MQPLNCVAAGCEEALLGKQTAPQTKRSNGCTSMHKNIVAQVRQWTRVALIVFIRASRPGGFVYALKCAHCLVSVGVVLGLC